MATQRGFGDAPKQYKTARGFDVSTPKYRTVKLGGSPQVNKVKPQFRIVLSENFHLAKMSAEKLRGRAPILDEFGLMSAIRVAAQTKDKHTPYDKTVIERNDGFAFRIDIRPDMADVLHLHEIENHANTPFRLNVDKSYARNRESAGKKLQADIGEALARTIEDAGPAVRKSLDRTGDALVSTKDDAYRFLGRTGSLVGAKNYAPLYVGVGLIAIGLAFGCHYQSKPR